MTALALDVLRYVLIYGAGVVTAVLLFGAGYLVAERDNRAALAASRRREAETVAAANAAVDEALDELAVARSPKHLAMWEAELEGSE